MAWYAEAKKSETICDLCTGCGIIPLILCRKNPPKKIYAVDIQGGAIELLRRSANENRLENLICPLCEDLKELGSIPSGSVDKVTVNPPYMISGSGYEKLSEEQAIARHEIKCNINDVCGAAAKLLKYGGYLKMCNRPDRLADVIAAMRENGMEPKKITFVFNKINEKPWLFLITGKRGGKPGLIIEKPMTLQNMDGSYTKEYKKLYE